MSTSMRIKVAASLADPSQLVFFMGYFATLAGYSLRNTAGCTAVLPSLLLWMMMMMMMMMQAAR